MTKHGKRLDRVLEKALNTPPKPHKTNKKKGDTGGMTKHGKRLDRVLEKALNTPPKPHKTNKTKGDTGHAQRGRRGS